jgi:hypothetical protein
MFGLVCVTHSPAESLDQLLSEVGAFEVGDGYAFTPHDRPGLVGARRR